MNADNATEPQPQGDTALTRQAYGVLLRHQPAGNTAGYEHSCAVCGHRTPCPPRRQAQAALADHGYNPFPTPADLDATLGLPPVG
jgi:hypothetical protein